MTVDTDTITDALIEIAEKMMPNWWLDMSEYGNNYEIFKDMVLEIWNKYNPELAIEQGQYYEYEIKKRVIE